MSIFEWSVVALSVPTIIVNHYWMYQRHKARRHLDRRMQDESKREIATRLGWIAD